MKLSTRSRYGARILVDLAYCQDKGPVCVGEISNRQNISVKYPEQLIRPLKKAKLVSSIHGPKGGHMLAQKLEEITLWQIVRLFEAQSDLVACIGNPEKCPMSDDCRVRLEEKTITLFRRSKRCMGTISQRC